MEDSSVQGENEGRGRDLPSGLAVMLVLCCIAPVAKALLMPSEKQLVACLIDLAIVYGAALGAGWLRPACAAVLVAGGLYYVAGALSAGAGLWVLLGLFSLVAGLWALVWALRLPRTGSGGR